MKLHSGLVAVLLLGLAASALAVQFRTTSQAVLSTFADSNIDKSQDKCVMCQYYVERMQYDLRRGGAAPYTQAMAVQGMVMGEHQNPQTNPMFLETGSKQSPAFMEVMEKAFSATHVAALAVREAHERVPTLKHGLQSKANLFFRSLDANHDKQISAADFEYHGTMEHLARHAPGVTKDEMLALIELGDKNSDKALSRSEFLHALSGGLRKSARPELQSLVEVESQAEPSTGPATDPQNPPKPTHMPGQKIQSQRVTTRAQREVERRRYNQIYRMTDLTLDDVCESATPVTFYGYCEAIYSVQGQIVDGLRYDYRPTDICFRVNMCGHDTYVANGIHSPYYILEHFKAEQAASGQAPSPAAAAQ